MSRSNKNSTRKEVTQHDTASSSSLLEDKHGPTPSYAIDVEIQDAIGKKLSNVLDKMFDEVQVAATTTAVHKNDDDKEEGVLLLSSSNSLISAREMLHPKKVKKQTKPQLKRKRHVDGSESDDEDTKVRAVAVSADWVKNSKF